MTITGSTGVFAYDTLIFDIIHFLKLEKEVEPHDKFCIEHDPSALHTILLHYSEKYATTKALCYIPERQPSFNELYPFIVNSLHLAWVEYQV